MIEIIAIIWLARRIKEMVKAKGLKPAKYIWSLIILWISFEVFFVIIGLSMLNNELAAFGLGLIGAAIGGTIAYQNADRAKPLPPIKK